MINALDQVGDKLDQLKALGIKIALDDFGTGYSSLNYLRNLHCDILKIDKSFINDIGNDAENVASIIEAITVLAKTLSFEVVAEGVETKDQATFLKNIGCDYLQGYYFSKPIMHNELMAMLYEHSYKKIF